jgi:DNA polymerase I
MASERVVLVDGTALVYRAWYALPANLRTATGLTANAIFGFASTFRKLFAGKRPSHGAVVFDAPGPTFRDERYADYKAQRQRMPDELKLQLPWIDRVVEVNAFPLLRVPGVEADDVIGTLAVVAEARGWEVRIVSGDKDFAQLISDRVRMFDPIRDVTYDPELVRKKWGVAPERFVDYLALLGDKSDNVPGVPGIGAKGAAALLERFGDLDTLLASTDQLKGRQRASLEEHRAQALLSRELVTLELAVPLDRTLDDLALQDPDPAPRNALYRELQFFSLIERDEVAAEQRATDHGTIDTLQALEETVDWLMGGREPVGLAVVSAEELAIAPEPGEAWRVPLTDPRWIELLRPWLESTEHPKVIHDLRAALVLLADAGIELRGVTFDVRLASFLVDPSGLVPHRLDQIARQHLQRVLPEQGSAARADATLALHPILAEQLERVGQADHLAQRDMPLSPVLAAMQRTGIRIDVDQLNAAERDFAAKVEAAEERAWALAGRQFNLKSTKQLGEVLFDELGLPVIKRTKTGYSTNAAVLERLAPDHEIARVLLEHRKFIKLINTYTAVLRDAIDPATGRVHAATQQTVGVSGRLITTDPDLQRTPVSSQEGLRIRRAFVTEPGWSIISADWSQIELRVLAHMSGDPLLVEAFARGLDVHARTAAELFGVRLETVTRDQRQVGKTVNFATVYGQGATALGHLLGVPRSEAKRYHERYFATYAGVRRWLDRTVEEASERGYVTTLLGRRRLIPELSANDVMLRQAGGRIAANTPIQGSAADICKLVMLQIPPRLRDAGLRARMLVQIHDELLFEAPDDEVEQTVELVRDAMENAVQLEVPLPVDVGVGASWADAK